MVTILIGIANAPQANLRMLASMMDCNNAELEVLIYDVIIDRRLGPRSVMPRGTLDRILSMVQELAPKVISILLSRENSHLVLELCQHIQLLFPELTIDLWGYEAETRRSELEELGYHVRFPTAISSIAIDHRPYEGYLGELIRVSRNRTVLVEPLWGARPLEVSEMEHGRLTDLSPSRSPLPDRERLLTVDDMVALISPLLRAGLTVRLRDPDFCEETASLSALLARLSDKTSRLIVELRAQSLDEGLVQQLLSKGLYCLELDLTSLMFDDFEPSIEKLLLRLVEHGQQLVGLLTFGHPAMAQGALGQAMDRCFHAGIEDLSLRRLQAPPHSPLAKEAKSYGLRTTTTPPYEVLYHHNVSYVDMLHDLRLVACYNLLRERLAGTGVLRTLAMNVGSASEVLEGFGDWLASQHHDPLDGEIHRPAEKLFAGYLRRYHGVDLELQQDQRRVHRVPGLSVRWLVDGRRLVTHVATGRAIHVGRHTLALLDRFDKARTIHEICEHMEQEVSFDQRKKLHHDIRITIEKLLAMGLLEPVQNSDRPNHSGFDPFTSLEEFDYHYRMLADTDRVARYREAIERSVRPGMHVVEIGTGTGILAVLAARAGARVTAIEQYSVLEIARAVVARSDVADRITLIQGRSDLVDLEEPGDLLLSEIVGNRILNEALLEMTLDARRRLLKPGAILLPCGIEIWAEVGQLKRFAHLEQEFSRLSDRYDVELQPVLQWFQDRQTKGHVVTELGRDDDDFCSLTDEALVGAIDLGQIENVDFSTSCAVTVREEGLANAVLLSFTLHLQPQILLSTRGQHELHWSKPLFMFPAPIPLNPRRPLRLKVSYEAYNDLSVSLAD